MLLSPEYVTLSVLELATALLEDSGSPLFGPPPATGAGLSTPFDTAEANGEAAAARPLQPARTGSSTAGRTQPVS